MSFAVELDYSSILKAAVAVKYTFDQLFKNTDNRKYYILKEAHLPWEKILSSF